MSEVLDDPAEKRKALENCLANDLQHTRARRSLAILEGRLKADEIVNPDRLPPTPAGLRAANAEREASKLNAARRNGDDPDTTDPAVVGVDPVQYAVKLASAAAEIIVPELTRVLADA